MAINDFDSDDFLRRNNPGYRQFSAPRFPPIPSTPYSANHALDAAFSESRLRERESASLDSWMKEQAKKQEESKDLLKTLSERRNRNNEVCGTCRESDCPNRGSPPTACHDAYNAAH